MLRKINKFLEFLEAKIHSAGGDRALALARVYGNIAWNNPVGRYQADRLEDVVFQKLKSVPRRGVDLVPAVKVDTVLHVLTEGYASGGHTRVLERLVLAQSVHRQKIVVVEICPESFIHKLTAAGVEVQRIESVGVAAVVELANLMSSHSTVILHLHPDDIVSSMAARIARQSGSKIALYNHADHRFTFGLRSVDVVCEISVYGRVISEAYRPDYPWSFAGIPLDVDDGGVSSLAINGEFILSSGPAYKFEMGDGGVFAKLIDAIVGRLGINMIIIGPGKLPVNAPETLKEFERTGRLRIMPALPYASYVEYLRSSLCYLDSAPVTGGSALPEAAIRGVPCVGLENPIMGYSPVDQMRLGSVESLVERVANIAARSAFAPEVSSSMLLEAHMPNRVLERIVASVKGSRFEIPYKINTSSLDVDYFQKQWLKGGSISIHTRAFDYVSVADRIAIGLKMWSEGFFHKMGSAATVKLFLSEIRSRKFRNR